MLLLSWAWLSVLDDRLDLLQSYNIHHTQVVVSYYETGVITANGEMFDPEGLTCASPRLPFNTMLLLKGPQGTITVRCNDRGPFKTDSEGKVTWPLEQHPVRKLDLTRRAFRELFGDTAPGLGEVTILRVRLSQDTRRRKI